MKAATNEQDATPVWLVMVRRPDGARRPYDWRGSERLAKELAAKLRVEGVDAFVVKSAPRATP